MKADEELRASLREPHDEARAHANWEAIGRRRHRVPAVPVSRVLAFGLALGAGLAVVIALAMFHDAAPGPLALEDGSVASGVIDRDVVTLDDGSRVAMETGARLEILENAGDHVRFWLHEGAARFDVVPGGPRRWVIESGLVTVEVLGTAFRVEHGEREVRVSVDRGSVLVRGPTAPDGMRRLGAGESLAVPTGEGPVAAVAPEDLEPIPGPVVEQPSAPVHEPREELASPGRDEDVAEPAIEPVTETGRARATEPPAARLRDADALRAAGRLDEAALLLERIADDPTAGDERALAAFTRARIELDRRHRPVDAAAAFAQAIALGLREPLLEDARARRVEALARTSDHAATRAAAAEYLALHPDGRWRSEVERWSTAP